MIRVYIADEMLVERSALRLMLLDLNMEIAGEADNWSTTVAEMPICGADMLLTAWELLPTGAPSAALHELRRACPKALVIILISRVHARQQAAITAGADMVISKVELPDRVAERLRAAAAKIRTG